MSTYIHYTHEQKERARQTDIAELLRSQGETLKRSGSEYEWRDGGQKVTVRGNLWFHQYDREGGDAIDFVRRFYHKNHQEANGTSQRAGAGKPEHLIRNRGRKWDKKRLRRKTAGV